MTVSYTHLIIVAFFRELLGTGGLEIFGKQLFSIPVLAESPMSIFIMPPGAFIVLGLLIALFRMIGVLKNE